MGFIDSIMTAGQKVFNFAEGIIKGIIPVIGDFFLNPGGLITILFLIPFVLIYLIKPKPRKESISSLMFLIRDKGKSIIKSFFKTLFADLLFFLQLLIFLILIAGVAELFITVPETTLSKDTVSIIDTSGSMQAQGRFKEAISLAKDNLGPTNTIILASKIPTIAGESISARDAREVLDSIKPTETGTNIYDSILASADYLEEDGRVHVYSDFIEEANLDTARKTLESKGIVVYYHDLAEEGNNIGFIDADITEEKTSLLIKNYNTEEVTARIKVNGDLIDTKKIDAETSEISTFQTPPGVSKVELDIDDDFELDNIFHLSAPEDITSGILVISNDENFYNSDLALALDSINANTTTKLAYDLLVPPKTKKINHDIIIFYKVDTNLILPGIIEDTKKRVEEGGAAIIMAQDDLFSMDFQGMLPFTYVGTRENGVVQRLTSSITENIDFGFVAKYFDVDINSEVSTLAIIEEEPIIAINNLGRGRLVYYGIIENGADFPKEPYYPIFWKRIVDYASGRPNIDNLNWKTGQTLTLTKKQRVRTPDGEVTGSAIYLQRAGVYTLQDRKIAVNLIDEVESDIDPVEIANGEAIGEDTSEQDTEMDLVRWLIIAAGVFILIELIYVKYRGDI